MLAYPRLFLGEEAKREAMDFMQLHFEKCNSIPIWMFGFVY